MALKSVSDQYAIVRVRSVCGLAPQAHAPTRIWAPDDVSINEVCVSTGQAIDLPRASSGKTQGSFALENKPILFMCVHIVCALVCCLHTLSKRPMCLLWRCPRAAFTDSREASPYLEAHVGGKGGRPTKSTDHCVKCGSTVCVAMCGFCLALWALPCVFCDSVENPQFIGRCVDFGGGGG